MTAGSAHVPLNLRPPGKRRRSARSVGPSPRSPVPVRFRPLLRYDNLATVYEILLALNQLERAYARSSISDDDYTYHCKKLIQHYKVCAVPRDGPLWSLPRKPTFSTCFPPPVCLHARHNTPSRLLDWPQSRCAPM